MSTTFEPDVRQMFRLPWTASDNAVTWLEPTGICNITCDACFVENAADSQKTLPQIQHELEVLLRLRRCDAMLIAGGEPLTHPQVVDIVRLVKKAGVKPILVTNGVGLDRSLLRELKQAGAAGLTLHVDSHQARPGWVGKNERELNELRGEFADLLYEEGGLTCAFNTTIFPDTLDEVPDIVEWAIRRPDRVHILTLICVRTVHKDDPYDYYVGDKLVDYASGPCASAQRYAHLKTEDIYREIKQVLPDFEFCAYLGGTVNPQSLKWVIGCVVSSTRRPYGRLGARSMELLQNGYHAFRNRYLAFSPPRANRSGKFTLLLSVLDPQLRKTARTFGAAILKRPRELFRKLHVQTISVVQPTDILPTGEWDACDGCPNKTFWQERLVSACRVEEYRKYGAPVRVVPRSPRDT